MAMHVEIVSDFHTGAEVAQKIGEAHIQDQHLGDKVRLISSGLLVEIPDTVWDYGLVCYVLSHAKALSQETPWLDRTKYNFDQNYRDSINNHAKKMHGLLQNLNLAHRLEFHRLLGHHLSYTPTQTTMRDDVALVLGLRPENYPWLLRIYNPNGVANLTTLDAYIPKTPALPSLEGQSITSAGERYIAILQQAMPKVIDRFVGEQYPSL